MSDPQIYQKIEYTDVFVQMTIKPDDNIHEQSCIVSTIVYIYM